MLHSHSSSYKLTFSFRKVQHAGVKGDLFPWAKYDVKHHLLMLCIVHDIGLCKWLTPPNMDVLLLETQFYFSLAWHISLITHVSVLSESSLFPVKAKAWLLCITCCSSGLELPAAAFLNCLKQNQRCSKSPVQGCCFPCTVFIKPLLGGERQLWCQNAI